MVFALAALLAAAPVSDPTVVARLVDVEQRLRATPTPHLTPEVFARRQALLDALALYRSRGVFPHNHQVPGDRHPVFIDEHGAACAVGFLMMASGHDALAREIAARENFARVPELRHPGVGAWAAAHGFSVDELTAIQPSYSYRPEPCDVFRTWVASPTVSYLLTHSHHLWRLEASGRRGVVRLPQSLVRREFGDTGIISACSTDEDTVWLSASEDWNTGIDRLLVVRWDAQRGAFSLESPPLPTDDMTDLTMLACRPGAASLYTGVPTPPLQVQNMYYQARSEAVERAQQTGERMEEPEVEFALQARFFTFDGPEGWRALPPLNTTVRYSGSWGFYMPETPGPTVRWSARPVDHCLALEGASWRDAPCPPTVPYEFLVSRLDEEEREAAEPQRDRINMRPGRPTYLAQLGGRTFSVGRTERPDCEPVLRDDVEPFVQKDPSRRAWRRRATAWTLALAALSTAGAGWLVVRRRRRRP